MLLDCQPSILKLIVVLKLVNAVDTTQQLTYLSPPPLYKPLCGPSAAEKGVEHNLMSHFVCMRATEYGQVLDRTEMRHDGY